MKEKTKLRIIQLLCVCSLLITVFSIQRTYAKYFEKVDTTYNTGIKKWIITMNNNDVHKNKDLSKYMTPVLVENENMKTGILAPGREGYFDFVVDYSKVELPFRFEFDLKQLNKKLENGIETENPLKDFNIYGFKIIDGVKEQKIDIEKIEDISISIDPLNNIITPKIVNPEFLNTLDDDKKVEIQILFKWNDDETNQMTNYDDTTYKGTENPEDIVHELLKYNVKIRFIQELNK